jgi:hypothetical protein
MSKTSGKADESSSTDQSFDDWCVERASTLKVGAMRS